MTDHKYTPGPWCVKPDINDGEMCFISANEYTTAFPSSWIACCCTGIDESEWEANAILIAAAPDMLEALRAALDYMGFYSGEYDCQDQIDLIKSAIAKAEGKDQ